MAARTSLLWLAPVIVACAAHLQHATPSDQPTTEVSTAPSDTVWYFLDGHRIARTDLSFIDRTAIASVSHWVGPAARQRHGADARDIVELVSSSSMSERASSHSTSPGPLYLLDGREVPEALVRVLDSTRIRGVEVLKGFAALPYGERARAGVVLIATKARAG